MVRSKTLGTQLQLGDGGATEVFTTIAQLHMIGGLETVTEIEDVTTHDSSDGYREHIETGLYSYNEIPFEGVWDEAHATHDDSTGIRSKVSGGPHNFKIIFPDASTTTASFAASVVNLQVGEAPLGGKLPITGSLKISGQITWS